MSNAAALFRSLVIYGLSLPLAVALGYLLASPLDLTTITAVGIILGILSAPLFLRWHHPWLIACWNMSAVVFFLPGRPPVWICVAAISFVIGVMQFTVNRNFKFLNVPSVTRPLILLALVVLITARLTGGIGLRALGSQVYGGRYYVFILAAIVGYFALISRPIPPKRGLLYASIFFLGVATMAIGELPRVLPPSFNFIFLIFPVMRNWMVDGTAVAGPIEVAQRVTGLGWLGSGLFSVMLVRYGLRGIVLEPGKPWRAILFAACIVSGLMGGFRSTLITFMMTLTVLFYLERLLQTRRLPISIIGLVLAGALAVAFADRMPFSVQRSMAFLPVKIDPVAKLSAEASTEWRLQMWRDLLPQVPQYLILGKGYGFSGREAAMVQREAMLGRGGSEGSEMAGDYHNGPLSVIIPFGIFGVIAFFWFLAAALRVVYHNYQFGDPEHRQINTFLFATFMVKIVFFFLVFGALPTDLATFVGLVGLSISLNGGVAQPVVVPQPKIAFNRFRVHPSARQPVEV